MFFNKFCPVNVSPGRIVPGGIQQGKHKKKNVPCYFIWDKGKNPSPILPMEIFISVNCLLEAFCYRAALAQKGRAIRSSRRT